MSIKSQIPAVQCINLYHTVLLISVLALLHSCISLQSPYGTRLNSEQFKDKFSEYISADETILQSWYHFVKTQDQDNTYVLRTFFPETKQLISEAHYADKNLQIQHGQSKSWTDEGTLISTGQYAQGQQSGQWTYYHRRTGSISSQGNYARGKRQGTWIEYDLEGRKSAEYSYMDDLLEGEFTIYDSLGVVVNQGVYTQDELLHQSNATTKAPCENPYESMPHLAQCSHHEESPTRDKCSQDALLKYVYESIRYPAIARKYEIQGLAVVQFVIEKDGSISNIHVAKGLCQSIKEECERVVGQMPAWAPGKQCGEPVKVEFTLPIRFRLG